MNKLEEILNQKTGNLLKDFNLEVKEIDFLLKDFYNENGGFDTVSMIRIGYVDSEKIKYLNIYSGIGMKSNRKDISFSITEEKIELSDFPIYVYNSVVTEVSNIYGLISEIYEEYLEDEDYIFNIVNSLEESKYISYSFNINKENITKSDVDNLREAYENILSLYEKQEK